MIESRRVDRLTAGRVDVAIVFREMLGAEDAAAYMEANGIPRHVADRVLAGMATAGTRDGANVGPCQQPGITTPVVAEQKNVPASRRRSTAPGYLDTTSQLAKAGPDRRNGVTTLNLAILLLFGLTDASAARDEVWTKAYVDKSGNLHVVGAKGRQKTLTADGRATRAALSADKKTVAWLVRNDWVAEGDVGPGASRLGLYRNRSVHYISCAPFIRDYWFWKDGQEVAIDCGGRHFAGTLILYNSTTGKPLDEYVEREIPDSARPAWSTGEDAGRPPE